MNAPEDRRLSPYTGYTRAHWLEITEQLIAGVLPYFDPDTGIPKLGGVPEEQLHYEIYPRAEAAEEAFERTLMLVAIYTAATGRDTVPGFDGSITAPYLKALVEFTEPGRSRYWGSHPEYSAFGTNVAMAMLLSPKFLWDPLSESQQRNVLLFLARLVRTTAYDCNCWYFPLMAVPMLERHGVKTDRARATALFERTLNWYRGDGWFIDGGNKGFDYYNLWGFQLYNNALTHFDAPWRDRFGGRVGSINREFARSFVYLFGRDGGPVPFGRSLTYRFAGISAIGYALLNGRSALPPGQARRIASGCLKYFWDHGALSENGLLEAGFHGPNSVVAEPYIARSSPYWAAHGLIPLVLGEDHPFWTERELPAPADGAGGRIALPGPHMVLRVSPIDGEARVYKVGAPFEHYGKLQRGVKYFQHAYSSYLGFAALGEGGRDLLAGRTGVSYDSETWFYRSNPRALRVEADHVVSVYDMELERPDPALEDFGEVTTHTLVGDDGEVHVFWHNSARPAYLAIGGYSISVPHGEELQRRASGKRLLIQGGGNRSVIEILDAPPGELHSELLEPREGRRHSHIFDGKGAYPYWSSRAPVPPLTPVVVYVNGARSRELRVPEISISRRQGLLRIRFEGVTHEVEAPLGQP